MFKWLWREDANERDKVREALSQLATEIQSGNGRLAGFAMHHDATGVMVVVNMVSEDVMSIHAKDAMKAKIESVLGELVVAVDPPKRKTRQELKAEDGECDS